MKSNLLKFCARVYISLLEFCKEIKKLLEFFLHSSLKRIVAIGVYPYTVASRLSTHPFKYPKILEKIGFKKLVREWLAMKIKELLGCNKTLTPPQQALQGLSTP
jgi:hypothetical protein